MEMEMESKTDDKSSTVMDNTKKRSSLSRIFRMKTSKSSLDGGGKNVDDSTKRSTLSRLLNLRKSDGVKDEIEQSASKARLSEGNGSNSNSKRGSLIMRSLVIPWLSRRSSSLNVTAPINILEDITIQVDPEVPQEVISSTTNF
ncbi:unnamed protein product [Diamesa tonsa]